MSSNLNSPYFELCGEADAVSDTVGVVIALLTGEEALGIANDSEVDRGIAMEKSNRKGIDFMNRRFYNRRILDH